MRDGRPWIQSRTILANLDVIREDLEHGAIVVIGNRNLRVRRLPIRS